MLSDYMLPSIILGIHLSIFAFISSFLLYFLDKYKRKDYIDLILSFVCSSLIAFLMIQRLELTALYLALFIAVLFSKKVDKLSFIIGIITTPLLFLLYGAYDLDDLNSLMKTFTTCGKYSCKWPLLLILLIIAFYLDEILHEKFPKLFESRLLFPFLSLVLLFFNLIEFEIFIIYIAFDLGYGLMKFKDIY